MKNAVYENVVETLTEPGRVKVKKFGQYLGERAKKRRLEQGQGAQEVANSLGILCGSLNFYENRLPVRCFGIEDAWEDILCVPRGWLRDPRMLPEPHGFRRDPILDEVVELCARRPPPIAAALAAEMRDLCVQGSGTNVRMAAALQALYGLAEGDRSTPAAISKRFELAPGRLNEMERQLRSAINSADINAPELARLHESIGALLPAQVSVIDSYLRGDSSETLSILDIERFCANVLENSLVRIESGAVGRVALPEGMSYADLVRINEFVVKMIELNGAACISLLAGLLSEHQQCEVLTSEVERLCAALPEFQWLDRDSGWFWLGAGRASYVRSMAMKKMSVATQRIEIDEFRSAIARDRRHTEELRNARLGFANPPPEILEDLLALFPESVKTITQHAVRARVRIRPEDVLSPLELATLFALEDCYGVGPLTKISRLIARRADCTEAEAVDSLSTSCIAIEVRPGVYRLCGRYMDPQAFETACRERDQETEEPDSEVSQ